MDQAAYCFRARLIRRAVTGNYVQFRQFRTTGERQEGFLYWRYVAGCERGGYVVNVH